jgi:hypothetical protein
MSGLVDKTIQETCITIFDGVRLAVQPFIPVCFLMRVLVGQMTGNPSEIKEAFKGVILAGVLFLSYSQILSFVFEIKNISELSGINEIIQKAESSNTETKKVFFDKKDPILGKEKEEGLNNLFSFPRTLRFVLEVVTSVIFWFLTFSHTIILFFISAFAPIIFVLGCVLGLGILPKLFFSTFALISLWPIIFVGIHNTGDIISTSLNLNEYLTVIVDCLLSVVNFTVLGVISKSALTSNGLVSNIAGKLSDLVTQRGSGGKSFSNFLSNYKGLTSVGENTSSSLNTSPNSSFMNSGYTGKQMNFKSFHERAQTSNEVKKDSKDSQIQGKIRNQNDYSKEDLKDIKGFKNNECAEKDSADISKNFEKNRRDNVHLKKEIIDGNLKTKEFEILENKSFDKSQNDFANIDARHVEDSLHINSNLKDKKSIDSKIHKQHEYDYFSSGDLTLDEDITHDGKYLNLKDKPYVQENLKINTPEISTHMLKYKKLPFKEFDINDKDHYYSNIYSFQSRLYSDIRTDHQYSEALKLEDPKFHSFVEKIINNHPDYYKNVLDIKYNSFDKSIENSNESDNKENQDFNEESKESTLDIDELNEPIDDKDFDSYPSLEDINEPITDEYIESYLSSKSINETVIENKSKREDSLL